MKTITLKNIPAPLHEALKQRARQNERSLNKEALLCIEKAVMATPVDVSTLLNEIKAYRETLPGQLTDGLIHQAKKGRS